MIGAIAATIALTAATLHGPSPIIAKDAVTQDHCNYAVCIGAWSVGGSGPDIIAAEVQTRGMFPVREGTVMYLNYGPTPALARTRGPKAYCIAETTTLNGCIFWLNETLNVGWVLCGQIIYYQGYPCIRIG